MNSSKLLQKNQSALIIATVYFAFGAIYIYSSDFYIRTSLTDINEVHLLNNQTAIRAVFIFLSSLLLFFLIQYYYRKLEGSSTQYKMLFYENPHPMWIMDIETLQFVDVNEAAIDKYGYTRSQFLSMKATDIRPEAEKEKFLAEAESWSKVFNRAGIWKHQKKNGEIIEVEISTHTIDYENRPAKLVLAYDVTDRVAFENQILEFNRTLEERVNERTKELHVAIQEQAALAEELETYNEELMSTNEQLVVAQQTLSRQAEAQVRQTEYRLEQVLNSVKDFIWSARYHKDKLFEVEMMSPAVADILGFTHEEYMNDKSLWFKVIAEEDHERIRAFQKTLGSKPYAEIEFCVRHPKTWQVKYVLSRVWASKLDEGLYHLNGIISDVSERKRQEEERSNLIKQLISQNNDLLQFSYIASHNLRGPVATLLGLIHLMEKEDKPSDMRAISTHLLFSTRKLDEVIIDLAKILEIRGFQSLPKEEISLTEVVESIRETLIPMIQNSGAEIIIDFNAIDSLFAIKSYVHSILYNLISNGIKYRHLNRKPVIHIQSFKDDQKAGFIVRDNGLGIDMEKFQNKVFTLYQRFHNHVEGKGLGLYLVKTQTHALGGEVTIESTPEEGTSFTVTFPIHSEVIVS